MKRTMGLWGATALLLACAGEAASGGRLQSEDAGATEAPALDAAAEDLEAFRTRIFAASEAEDAHGAMLALIFTDGMDQWESDLAGRTAERLAGIESADVSFEPLPDDFEEVNVVDGAELRAYPTPEGLVTFSRESGATSSIPYGREQGRYWIIGTRRTVVAEGVEDATLQILAMGFASPPAEFQGWCDVLLSNGEVRRVEVDDQGIGNQTRIVRGQAINACELRNTGGRGALSLRLLVDSEEVFEGRAEMPEEIVRYEGR